MLHDERKVPRQLDGQPASSTDAMTWASYIEAKAALPKIPRATGVGFVLAGDGIACIDLDKCIDDHGTLNPEVDDLLRRIPPTWVEVSPSGRGLHIWGLGSVGRGRIGAGVEVYDRARYITVTGRRWRDAPLRLGNIQSLVDSL